MLARDEQVAGLRVQGVSLRQIGARLGMSLASVFSLRCVGYRAGVFPWSGPTCWRCNRAIRECRTWPEQRAALEELAVAADEH